jgi:two-component system, NtrC family, response regulator GlrR
VLLGDPAVWDALSADPLVPPPTDDSRFTGGTSFREAKERAVATWERDYVRGLIAQHDGNLSRAARAVRMDRNHLRELLRRHRITADET